MIKEKITYDDSGDSPNTPLGTILKGNFIILADKINEIIDAVNRLDEQMQKLPPARAIHENLMEKKHE